MMTNGNRAKQIKTRLSRTTPIIKKPETIFKRGKKKGLSGTCVKLWARQDLCQQVHGIKKQR